MSKITLDHVSYVYSKGTPYEQKALDDVSLSIRDHCITGIIGHTGSGKSTMMQLLNGLAAPTSGKVLLDGYDVNTTFEDLFAQWKSLPKYENLSKSAAKKAIKKDIKDFRRRLCFRVGLVMQYPEYQLFEETVYKDIAFGPQNMGLSEEEIRERVMEAAAFSGVEPEWMEKSPFDLSGGQKRRVALAGVIAMRPEVLVLDEPGAGLDPRGRNSIFEKIVHYQKTTGSTVLIVSHSMEDMARLCDDVVVLYRAKIVKQGSGREVFSHADELSKIGLDIPQITRLLQMLKEKGMPISDDIYTVDEAVAALKQIL
ncbi:MAG: energy-coupling factor transporter ATPase [Ruminococcaceae bacterium]|nr:energy-coupling factor transporter ATPase [Oscillospiraceae bacterium]